MSDAQVAIFTVARIPERVVRQKNIFLASTDEQPQKLALCQTKPLSYSYVASCHAQSELRRDHELREDHQIALHANRTQCPARQSIWMPPPPKKTWEHCLPGERSEPAFSQAHRLQQVVLSFSCSTVPRVYDSRAKWETRSISWNWVTKTFHLQIKKRWSQSSHFS